MKGAILSIAAFAAGVYAGATTEPAYTTKRPAQTTIEPTQPSISAAAATAKPSSPTSNVKGKAFDRIVQIWLENQDYNITVADPNWQWLASQGISLTNYFAVTHPSEPNYAAVVAGDYFGMENDDFNSYPANISTVVDLLDTKGISWGEYQEHLPYAGFQGFNYSNQQNFANDYVRKHNPLVLFESVANNASKLAQIKSFIDFENDLAAKTLPQWSFVTPNMTNDGHDTNISFTAQWARNWLTPLLNNSYFMENTLVILTFDENEDYPVPNRIGAILLGGAIPTSLHGTTDSMYYNHYSTISTVSQNWGLPSLGRWDCGANVLALVSNVTGYQNSNISLDGLYFNVSYPGPMSDTKFTPGWWPSPDTQANCAAGSVLPAVVSTWGSSSGSYNYTNVYPYDAVAHVGDGHTLVIGVNDRPNATVTTSSPTAGTTSTSTASSSSAPSSVSKGAAMPTMVPREALGLVGALGLAAAFL